MKNIYSFDLGHLYETLGSLSEKDRDQLLETRKEILFLSRESLVKQKRNCLKKCLLRNKYLLSNIFCIDRMQDRKISFAQKNMSLQEFMN